MSRPVQNKTLLFALILGMLYSLLGSLLFEIIVVLEKIFREGPFSISEYERLSSLRFTNIFCLSFFPFILACLTLLVFLIMQTANGVAVSVKSYAVRGWLVGLGTGLFMCAFSYYFVLHNSSLDRFLFLTISGLIVSSFTGMAAGYQISVFVVKQLKKF